MKRVVVFRADLLPVSETFILNQIGAMQSWDPVLIGFRRVVNGLVPPGPLGRIVPRGNKVAFALRSLLTRPLPRLVAALKESNARLVHVHFGTDATAIWSSVRAAGLPMLVTLHGYDISIRREWWEAGHAGIVARRYPRRLLQMAHDPTVRFVAVSEAIRRRAIEYGIPDSRIVVSYIGVDTDRFKPGGLPLAQRRKRILFVGRMVEKKAPLSMVRAFARVRTRIPEAELVMIGDGPLLADARQLARDLQADVEFPGACGSEQVLAELHRARVLCLPSVTAGNGDAEGFGLAILEAQACGVPVVTSALGGASEGLLQGKTGHAVAEGDIGQITDRLSDWLLDDVLAANASRAAWQFVRETFNIRHCTQQLERVYESSAIATGSA
jgi:glycosyltransferase involved in cell wall biosynthesis